MSSSIGNYLIRTRGTPAIQIVIKPQSTKKSPETVTNSRAPTGINMGLKSIKTGAKITMVIAVSSIINNKIAPNVTRAIAPKTCVEFGANTRSARKFYFVDLGFFNLVLIKVNGIFEPRKRTSNIS
ncbi:hypothetical protein SUGI_0694270 [Cryptomeria japonica]|nr:hypothetical protein SUGI_0694270 [Cryptomeria japonica]